MWKQLESEIGEQIVYECGLMVFGREDSPMVSGTEAALRQVGVAYEVLSSASIGKFKDGPKLESKEVAIFVPEAGWVAANVALQGIQNLAKDRGVTFVHLEVSDLSDFAGYDAFVVAAGPWMNRFKPLDVTVTQQTYAYVKGVKRGGPVWIHDCPHLFYGFPSEPNADGFKLGIHIPGPEIEPDLLQRSVPEEDKQALKKEVESRFAAFANEVQFHTCLYTSTPDEDFRIGKLADNGFYVSACSGHGFKFGPWIGELMADLTEAKQSLADWPRFARS